MKNISIKGQLFLLLAIYMIVFVAAQFIYLIMLNKENHDTYTKYLSNSINQIKSNCDDFAEKIDETIGTLAYNNNVYLFSIADSLGKRLTIFNSLEVVVDFMDEYSDDSAGICLYNGDYICIGNLDAEYSNAVKFVPYLEGVSEKMTVTAKTDTGSKVYARMVAGTYDYVTKLYLNTIVFLNVQRLTEILNNAKTEYTYFCILDQEGNIVTESGEILSDDGLSKLEMIEDIKSYGEQETILGKTSGYHVQERDLYELGWKVVGIISFTHSRNEMILNYLRWNIVIFVIVMVMMLIVSFALYGNIIMPVSHLAEFVDNIGENLSESRLNLPYNNEIGVLSNSINIMLERIDKLTSEVNKKQYELYALELLKKQAEINTLYSKINPHFLNNTLDCMRGMVQEGRTGEITAMITSMTNIFRYSMDNLESTTISKELSFVKEYLSIMKIRHRNKLSIIYNIDDEILGCVIPKMIIQPLVENSIFHGIEPKDGKGVLELKIAREENKITISVLDDGIGINEDVLKIIQKTIKAKENYINDKHKHGLFNVIQRLKIICGDNCQIEVKSKKHEFTLIKISLDIITDEFNNINIVMLQ